MKRVMIGLLAIALVASACGSSKKSSPSSSSSSSTGSAAKADTSNIDPNGVLRVAISAAPNQWDPDRTVNALGDRPYMSQVYDPVIFLAPDDSLKPNLATA
jgi:ABC-type transport system substrate-binding protein